MSSSNGRVDVNSSSQTQNLFALYDKIPSSQCSTYRDALEGQWDNTQLSLAYFSKENVQIIQNGIRAGVYNKSNSQYIIPPQNCDTLKIIMRGIYLQYAANKPTHISEQISQLNNMVLNYCIPQAYSEAKGYMKYLRDVGTLVVPIAHPILAKNNDKELVLKDWF